MKYTIYKITNNLNGKFYIGKHQTTNPNDTYFGSGKAIINAIKFYGKSNFTKEVLFIFDSEFEMNAKEKELITEEFVAMPDTYNLGIGGEGGAHFKGRRHSLKTKEKISVSNTGKSLSEESRQKSIGRKHSIITKQKISLAAKSRKVSDETKQKISKALKGRKVSTETKEKISNTMKARNK
jgi:group I intron endonuclease